MSEPHEEYLRRNLLHELEAAPTEQSRGGRAETMQCCDPIIDGHISALLEENARLRAALSRPARELDEREYIDRIERLNIEINRIENNFGRGPFYDGILRERLTTLWQKRHDLSESRKRIARPDAPPSNAAREAALEEAAKLIENNGISLARSIEETASEFGNDEAAKLAAERVLAYQSASAAIRALKSPPTRSDGGDSSLQDSKEKP